MDSKKYLESLLLRRNIDIKVLIKLNIRTNNSARAIKLSLHFLVIHFKTIPCDHQIFLQSHDEVVDGYVISL